MRSRLLRVMECPTENPAADPVVINALSAEIGPLAVDDALARAKAIVAEAGKVLRSLSVTTDGNVVAIVWSAGTPTRGRVPGWIWRRPPSSEE